MKRTKAMAYRRRIESAAALQDDSAALESVWMYPDYDDLVVEQKTVTERHFRFRYNGKLYRTEQQVTVFDGTYPPGAGTESLYSEVTLPQDGGTAGNPIAYSGNMELFKDRYYSQNGQVYHCIRSTGAPVYNDLSDLVGIYVEAV